VGVTGGLLDVETDAIKAVKGILGHIETKRTGLGI
jgi:hydroxylamine reductase (hybrid-cluster protein)